MSAQKAPPSLFSSVVSTSDLSIGCVCVRRLAGAFIKSAAGPPVPCEDWESIARAPSTSFYGTPWVVPPPPPPAAAFCILHSAFSCAAPPPHYASTVRMVVVCGCLWWPLPNSPHTVWESGASDHTSAMIGENRQLVTDQPVEFEK